MGWLRAAGWQGSSLLLACLPQCSPLGPPCRPSKPTLPGPHPNVITTPIAPAVCPQAPTWTACRCCRPAFAGAHCQVRRCTAGTFVAIGGPRICELFRARRCQACRARQPKRGCYRSLACWQVVGHMGHSPAAAAAAGSQPACLGRIPLPATQPPCAPPCWAAPCRRPASAAGWLHWGGAAAERCRRCCRGHRLGRICLIPQHALLEPRCGSPEGRWPEAMPGVGRAGGWGSRRRRPRSCGGSSSGSSAAGGSWMSGRVESCHATGWVPAGS